MGLRPDMKAHDPLDEQELEFIRSWLLRQPMTSHVLVYVVLRMLATIDAERGLVAEDAA